LTELCPFGHPSLHQITPQQVDEALKQLWEHTSQPGKRGSLVPTGDHDTAFSISHGRSET
jgi:ankyrin repeat protein